MIHVREFTAVLPHLVSVSHLRSEMGYDEPEALSCLIDPICLTGADVRQFGVDLRRGDDPKQMTPRDDTMEHSGSHGILR